ncbi:GntR family transcriptional regulator [Streptomyces zhaozhouensis]|uniref:GntR family transcriptional regulator n=1 Tax=Streptomyces zhaozhouensis TaxID=1300267 RepID=A0A286E9D2_9ACTN|nr:GntR family transcriptional regulator [Streptomyces zhaozhouensis]SOD67464.1 GntR family transcriptional regulator [Streptomyces zhaozhouensis]
MTGYMDIAGHYRGEIANGQLKPGARMPSQREAARLHQVNLTTVIRAYEVLQREGLITTHVGRGTVVTARPKVVVTGAQRAARLDSGGPDLADGETVSGRSVAVVPCTDVAVAVELGLEPGEQAVLRRRVFRTDEVPATYALTYIHTRALDYVPEIMTDGPLGDWRPMYQERTGKTVARSPERRSARHARADELAALEVNVPEGDVAVPVLVTQTTWHDDDGPLMVMEDVYRPGAWQISNA